MTKPLLPVKFMLPLGALINFFAFEAKEISRLPEPVYGFMLGLGTTIILFGFVNHNRKKAA